MSAITTVMPILLIGSIFMIIFIYKAIYKNNMNKALNGDATSGLMDLGSLLKTLAFVSLIIMNIVALTRINDLKDQISTVQSSLSSQITNLNYRISSISYEMEEYYESIDLVQEKHHELIDVNLSDDLYTYDISFTLLEKETDADVYLVLENDGVSSNILLTSTSLTYHHELELDYDTNDYNVSILIEGDVLTQKGLFKINVKEDAQYVVTARIGFAENQENFMLIAYVNEEVNFVEGLDVDRVVFNFYNNDTLEYTETLSSITNTNDLLAELADYDFVAEFDHNGNVFAITFEPNDMEFLTIEYIITLTDGTVMVRELDF